MRRHIRSPIAFACVVAITASASAQPAVSHPRIGAGARFFGDDLATTVWSPYANVGARLPEEVELDVGYEADVISSASVDVITAATAIVEEVRHEVGVRASRRWIEEGLDVRGAYTLSVENDTESHTGLLGTAHRFASDNVQLALQYALSWNRTGVAGEPNAEWGQYYAHSLDPTLTLTLDHRTELELGYSGQVVHGYQANPYRRVPVLLGDDLRFARWVEERVPALRIRNAGVVRLRHALDDQWVGQIDYRFYGDDWGVIAHTVTLEGSVELDEVVAVHARLRGTYQDGAWFYREEYREETRYLTRDRRLSPHFSAMGGLALYLLLHAPVLGEIRIHASADVIVWYFEQYGAPALTPTNAAQLETLGWVVGGVGALAVEVRP